MPLPLIAGAVVLGKVVLGTGALAGVGVTIKGAFDAAREGKGKSLADLKKETITGAQDTQPKQDQGDVESGVEP